MKVSKLLFLIMLTLVITGCSETNNVETETENISSNSYESLLFVYGKERQSVGKTSGDFQVEPGKLIGTVTTKYSIEIRPKQELTSNFLEEGAEIYSEEGKPNMLLAKKQTENMKFYKYSTSF